MFGEETPQPKLWKALLAAAFFVFPASLLLHALFLKVPDAIWYGISAVLWIVFAYNTNQRMQAKYSSTYGLAKNSDGLGRK